ncbi:hypothetical protein N7512_007931 [Penicillium capsulatum]|nr:hypothetical protein N7512_007931 [Penicillium capsulatum]
MTILAIAVFHSNLQSLHSLQKHPHEWADLIQNGLRNLPTELRDQICEILRVGFICFLLGTHGLAISTVQEIIHAHPSGSILGVSLAVPVAFLLIFMVFPRHWERAGNSSPRNLILASASTLAYMALNTHSEVLAISFTDRHWVYVTLAGVIFGYAAYIAMITFSFELKGIQDIPRALGIVQRCEMILYADMMIVIDVFVQPGADPAATALRPLCDGIAIPTVCSLYIIQEVVWLILFSLWWEA